MSAIPAELKQVTVPLKANVYFDGKVISHTLLGADGTKKTLGVIYPGSFTFNTGAPERMDILAGICQVRLKGDTVWKPYGPGATFHVPGQSAFDISVTQGIVEYLCTFE